LAQGSPIAVLQVREIAMRELLSTVDNSRGLRDTPVREEVCVASSLIETS